MKTLKLIKARLVEMNARLDGVVELATPLGDFNQGHAAEIAAHEARLAALRKRLRKESFFTHGAAAGTAAGAATGAALMRRSGRAAMVAGGTLGAAIGLTGGSAAGSLVRRKQRERK
jgi:hypothetical protein